MSGPEAAAFHIVTVPDFFHGVNDALFRHPHAEAGFIGRKISLKLLGLGNGVICNRRVDDMIQKTNTGNESIRDQHNPCDAQPYDVPAGKMVKFLMGDFMGKDETYHIITMGKNSRREIYPPVNVSAVHIAGTVRDNGRFSVRVNALCDINGNTAQAGIIGGRQLVQCFRSLN
ncbi:MAG: hypothetical protein WCY59_07415 [Anaerovoracaceae bacterium]